MTIVEALGAPLEQILGSRLGGWFAGLPQEEGVRMITGARLEGARGDERVEELIMGRRVPTRMRRRSRRDWQCPRDGLAARQWLEGTGIQVDRTLKMILDAAKACPAVAISIVDDVSGAAIFA